MKEKLREIIFSFYHACLKFLLEFLFNIEYFSSEDGKSYLKIFK